MRKAVWFLILVVAASGGFVWGQGGSDEGGLADLGLEELAERLAKVRREIKIIDFDESIALVPGLVEREREYSDLLGRMEEEIAAGKEIRPLFQKARELKRQQLADANKILKLHRGEHVGLSEEQVWERLANKRFTDLQFREEWLVNILDFLEGEVGINVELDARVYKFDTVTFDFEKTSARAMLQMMGDALLFKWVVRGDTLYVYKERNEILFGGEWLRRKRAAWKARKDALEEARKEAERRALEEDD